MIKETKEILRASPLTLEEAFRKADEAKQGLLTNLEFKKVFRSLGIALTSKEIDMLLNYCDFKPDKLINWPAFIRIFKLDRLQEGLWERARDKLRLLSDRLYDYMVSPNDAFRKYNDSRTSFMTFEQFHLLMADLSRQSRDPLPSHAVIRGLFDEIDVRRDGKIDHQEMIETFRFFPPPKTINGHNCDPKAKTLEVQPLDSLKREYDLIRLIGRNRKHLLEEFHKLAGSDRVVIPEKQITRVIMALCQKHQQPHSEALYRQLVAFAGRDGMVDYRLLLDIFKSRMERIEQFPKSNAF